MRKLILILAEIETSKDGKYCSLSCELAVQNEDGEYECPFSNELHFQPVQTKYTQERPESCIQAEKDLEQFKNG